MCLLFWFVDYVLARARCSILPGLSLQLVRKRTTCFRLAVHTCSHLDCCGWDAALFCLSCLGTACNIIKFAPCHLRPDPASILSTPACRSMPPSMSRGCCYYACPGPCPCSCSCSCFSSCSCSCSSCGCFFFHFRHCVVLSEESGHRAH